MVIKEATHTILARFSRSIHSVQCEDMGDKEPIQNYKEPHIRKQGRSLFAGRRCIVASDRILSLHEAHIFRELLQQCLCIQQLLIILLSL